PPSQYPVVCDLNPSMGLTPGYADIYWGMPQSPPFTGNGLACQFIPLDQNGVLPNGDYVLRVTANLKRLFTGEQTYLANASYVGLRIIDSTVTVLNPPPDAGDTLATAFNTSVGAALDATTISWNVAPRTPLNRIRTWGSHLGDGPQGAKDVDIYRF